jgi:guanosine-3',5'-bis(diphosphate) 3'-pyrophosphohydrolase
MTKALTFAIKAHDGQYRKYSKEPYVVHPIAVSEILKKYYPEATPAMVAAALLHDTVEDTDVTMSDIYEEFGLEIGKLVYWLTDVSKPHQGNRKLRKSIDRAHTLSAPPEAQIVKLADLIHNSQDILEWDKDFAVVYLKEKALILEGLKHLSHLQIYKEAMKCLK